MDLAPRSPSVPRVTSRCQRQDVTLGQLLSVYCPLLALADKPSYYLSRKKSLWLQWQHAETDRSYKDNIFLALVWHCIYSLTTVPNHHGPCSEQGLTFLFLFVFVLQPMNIDEVHSIRQMVKWSTQTMDQTIPVLDMRSDSLEVLLTTVAMNTIPAAVTAQAGTMQRYSIQGRHAGRAAAGAQTAVNMLDILHTLATR